MKRWFERMAAAIGRFMYGRYGNDELNLFLMWTYLALAFLSMIPKLYFLSGLSLALLVWSCVRSLSRNVDGRRRELEKYLQIKRRVTGWGRLQKAKWRDRKTHVYFRCKKCRAVIRVPKRKGGGVIHCPKCKSRIVRK